MCHDGIQILLSPHQLILDLPMKLLLLTIGFAFGGIVTSFSQAQSIPLTIDTTQSSVSISLNGNPSNSSLSGNANFEIQSNDPPSGNAQITDLNLVLDQAISFSFGFGFGFGIVVSSSPSDVTISTATPGTPGTITDNTFDQLANSLAISGNLVVSDPLNLAGGNQTFDLSELELGPTDFDSINVSQAGNVITISSAATIMESVDFGAGTMNLVVDVTYVASGIVPETELLGDVNLDGTVNFLDISPFIAILSTGEFQTEADIDQNEEVNFLDISPFIAVLSGQEL